MDKDIDIWKQRNEILHKKVNRQMDEIKDLHKKSETIFDLARRFPNKTYRELEKYRDADRQEEAQQIPLSESQKKQEELEPIEGEEQDNPELFDWKEQYNKERKLRQEAEGELTIVKGISVHMSPEMRDANKKIEELRVELDRVKKDNNDLLMTNKDNNDYRKNNLIERDLLVDYVIKRIVNQLVKANRIDCKSH